jgi:hypothetical protein
MLATGMDDGIAAGVGQIDELLGLRARLSAGAHRRAVPAENGDGPAAGRSGEAQPGAADVAASASASRRAAVAGGSGGSP